MEVVICLAREIAVDGLAGVRVRTRRWRLAGEESDNLHGSAFTHGVRTDSKVLEHGTILDFLPLVDDGIGGILKGGKVIEGECDGRAGGERSLRLVHQGVRRTLWGTARVWADIQPRLAFGSGGSWGGSGRGRWLNVLSG